jgi:exopolysaccharide production protein ExoZ
VTRSGAAVRGLPAGLLAWLLRLVQRVTDMRNDAIQGLRGIAALLVVVTHAVLTLVDHGVTELSDQQEFAWALGDTGVKIFFMISGFIMASTMYGQFDMPGAARSFVWRRIIRIVPIYWVTTILYAARLAIGGNAPPVADMVRSLLFVPYVNGVGIFRPVYGLGWTLNYEMFFYFLFALALVAPRRIGLSALIGSLVALVVAGAAFDHCKGQLCQLIEFYQKSIILYFAGGVLLAVCKPLLERFRWLPEISAGGAVASASVTVALYVIFVEFQSGHAGAAAFIQVLTCAFTVTVCAMSSGEARQGVVSASYLALGNASYSIYLLHGFLTGWMERFWVKIFDHGYVVAFIALMIVASSLLGLAGYRWFEKPMLRWLRSIGNRFEVSAALR